jgi:hypothetical protein
LRVQTGNTKQCPNATQDCLSRAPSIHIPCRFQTHLNGLEHVKKSGSLTHIVETNE